MAFGFLNGLGKVVFVIVLSGSILNYSVNKPP